MKQLSVFMTFCTMLIIGACVTINVYFPAAAAEEAAEQFVGEVLGEDATESRQEGRLFEILQPDSEVLLLAATNVLDFMIPSAQAQTAKIDINTPQINAIKNRMAARQQESLNGFFDAGAIGFSNDGLVTIRDRAAVPLSDRRNLESIVKEENRDRAAVYREIAVANGHPEWEQDIQETFAREWVSKARAGWYYQNASGAWVQK